MQFRLHWESESPLALTDEIWVRNTRHGLRVRPGDDVYVVSAKKGARLLGRLGVIEASHDEYRSRIKLRVGGPRTAVFFRTSARAPDLNIPTDCHGVVHREVLQLDELATRAVETACGDHDFSLSMYPPRWSTIVRQIGIELDRAHKHRDTRPDIEAAERWLRAKYVTSQLPGPAPVYQIAARRALGMDIHLVAGKVRNRYPLTNDAIRAAINEDVALSGQLPDSRRHQRILMDLRDRLVELGVKPQYDGLVDCIAAIDEFDAYFEIKSTSPGSVAHQVRTGLGQILHYIWLDTGKSSSKIIGHLVVEGPWQKKNESLREFAQSLSIRLIWANEIRAFEFQIPLNRD